MSVEEDQDDREQEAVTTTAARMRKTRKKQIDSDRMCVVEEWKWRGNEESPVRNTCGSISIATVRV